jgi:xanthine dehydrogenase YagT iron-sulfur-binding subunit
MPELCLRITGEDHIADVVPQVCLLGMRRKHLRLTGARKGYDQGVCAPAR